MEHGGRTKWGTHSAPHKLQLPGVPFLSQQRPWQGQLTLAQLREATEQISGTSGASLFHLAGQSIT